MPQKYKPKVGAKMRERVPPDTMKKAVHRVLEENAPLHTTAKEFGLSRNTLRRYVRKIQQGKTTDFTANYASNNVFTAEEEKQLAKDLETMSQSAERITTGLVRRLAYDLALKKSKKPPKSWEEKKEAGYCWLRGFLDRNKQLSIRPPEPL